MRNKVDFSVENHGTIALVRPLNQRAKNWLGEATNPEGWQWMGDALAVEPRYVRDLMVGMQEEGFTAA